jgi:O-antigen ligase
MATPFGLNAKGMEPFDRHLGARLPLATPHLASSRTRREKTTTRTRTPKSYRVCDALTGGLLCWMIVFTPWAFGTTENWSIWTMNASGFGLGVLLIVKWLIRNQTGYRPVRWNEPPDRDEIELLKPSQPRRHPLTMGLAALTLLMLGYMLVSAVNARAVYVVWDRRFEYRDCIQWLPHSYDQASSWLAFWTDLGLACFFWAARDWLLTKSSQERHRTQEAEREPADPSSAELGDRLPDRLRLLLWVLCINGSILALEAILQRLSGTPKLLWLRLPRFTPMPEQTFGPFAYRANAASYFNLVWPVCLGFWLMLRRAARPSLRSGHRLGSGNHLVLLPGAVLMAACPIVSTSRGGALIAVASILLTMSLLLWVTRKEALWFRVGTCSLFALILGFSAFLGLKELAPRFQTIFTDQLSRRSEIYDNALPIARDFPILGTGPGTFRSLYQLYRSPDQNWAAYVHDDWLETRITLGWVGLSMIVLMLGITVSGWFWGRGAPVAWEFVAMIWVGTGGALLHAKFDFPFQVYSIVLLFLLLCAILFCVSRPERGLA